MCYLNGRSICIIEFSSQIFTLPIDVISVMYAQVFKWQIIQKHVPTGISPALPWGALSLVSHYPILGCSSFTD